MTCYESLTPHRRIRRPCKVNDFVNQVYIPDLLVGAYRTGPDRHGQLYDLRRLRRRAVRPGGSSPAWCSTQARSPAFRSSKIEEHVRRHSQRGRCGSKPFQGVAEPKFTPRATRSLFVDEGSRYDGRRETGPLAQVLVAYLKGNAEVVGGRQRVADQQPDARRSFSTLLGPPRGIVPPSHHEDRRDVGIQGNVARHEDRREREVPDKGEISRATWCARGGLSLAGHREQKVANLLVVPSTWNLGPVLEEPSAVEEALVNTPIADPGRPVEILRTVIPSTPASPARCT